jgi:PTS system glucitol/sorbitol-specific IIC component
MTGGGVRPEPLDRILELSGMTAVNGNTEACPDEKVALAVIDCGGTLRCGIYPGKGIPTINILATGRSGPLAKYMTEDLYVSAVTSAEVSLTSPEEFAEKRQCLSDAVSEHSVDSRSKENIGKHSFLAEKLTSALKDDVPALVREGNFIAKGYSPALDNLQDLADNGKEFIKELLCQLRL